MTYAWRGTTMPGMGMNTAIAFTLTGALFVALALEKR